LDRKSATFNRGTAQENRETLGARLSRPPATKQRDWDFDYEGVWQFDTFGADDIRAWTLASDSGYSFPTAPLRPRISVKADVSSGDDPRHSSLGTFNPIYPIGNYFGVLADTGPGPVNFIDVHPRLQTWLPHGVSISTDVVIQWRESLYDGSTRFLVLCSWQRATAGRGLSDTGPAWRRDGRSIAMRICRRITGSSSPASF
jgi:hypothetical protein